MVHITKILFRLVAKAFKSSTSVFLLTHSHPKYLYGLHPAGNTIVMTVDHFDMVIMHSLAFGAT